MMWVFKAFWDGLHTFPGLCAVLLAVMCFAIAFGFIGGN
jgi:hypothetical protein